MAEYIDKDTAIQICIDSWDTGDASVEIKDEPPADVVEREKIDKAIDEMTRLLDSTNNIDLENRTYECIEILKRNIGGE